MTSLRSAEPRRTLRVDVLGDGDRRALIRLLAADPFVTVPVAARLRESRSMAPAGLGGTVLAVREQRAVVAAAFSGGNLIPIGGGPAAWSALAQQVAARPRVCSSIVGRADAVNAMWTVLSRDWRARDIRDDQRLLVSRRPGPAQRGDSRVRPIRKDEADRYLRAAAAMFTEELGVSPLTGPHGASYERRVRSLIIGRRAFGIVDDDGEVLFKADLGAVSAHTCQVQGVWVRPDARGRGIGTRALAAVLHRALQLAPTVSLYVNHFNVPARAMYARLGMRETATMATVLL